MDGRLPAQLPGTGCPGAQLRLVPETLGRFWRMLAHCHSQTRYTTELASSIKVRVTAASHYRDSGIRRSLAAGSRAFQ